VVNWANVYSDRASGAKERRPGLDALMADARRGAFHGLWSGGSIDSPGVSDNWFYSWKSFRDAGLISFPAAIAGETGAAATFTVCATH